MNPASTLSAATPSSRADSSRADSARNTSASNTSARAQPPAPPVRTVAYVMSRFPKLTETFVLFEILAVEKQKVAVEVYPLLGKAVSGQEVAGAGLWRKWREHRRAPARPALMHEEARPYVARAHYHGFLSTAIVWANMLSMLRHPRRYFGALAGLIRGTWGNRNYLFGGLAAFPKTVFFARQMQRDGVQHVHAHFANHPAAAAYVIHRLTGIPYSFTAHGSDLHRHQHMLGTKVRGAAFVVTISEYNRRVILEHCDPADAEKVRVLHCGVDLHHFSPAERRRESNEPLQIVCVGTLHEVKGQAYLLRAVAGLRLRGLACRLDLIGDGADRDMLERLAAELGLVDCVRFLGVQSRASLLQRLRAADVLVAPSVPSSDGRREGIPVVLMEGMACGLAVVASRLSGIPELINSDRVGCLCEPKDVDALTETLQRLAADDALRLRLGTAARQRIETAFSVDANAAKLIDMFHDAAGIPSAEPSPATLNGDPD